MSSQVHFTCYILVNVFSIRVCMIQNIATCMHISKKEQIDGMNRVKKKLKESDVCKKEDDNTREEINKEKLRHTI